MDIDKDKYLDSLKERNKPRAGQPKFKWQYAVDEVLKFMDCQKKSDRGFWMKKLKQHFDPDNKLEQEVLASMVITKIMECKHAQKPQGMFYNHVVKGITKLDI